MELQKIYYVSSAIWGEDEVVVVKHGETGYFKTGSILPPEAINALNARNGISEAEAIAAKECSMFDCWANFDILVRSAASRIGQTT